jgi:hypothetical protein
MLNNYWLPVVNAYIGIRAGRQVQALKFLETAAPYDLAFPRPQFSGGGLLYPVYVRGQAYLALRQGKEAAAEFQKFPTIVASRKTRRSLRWRTSALPAPTPCKPTPPKSRRLSGFSHTLEGRRSRYSHPEKSQSGVRKITVNGSQL